MTDHALTGPRAHEPLAPRSGTRSGRDVLGMASLQQTAGNRAVSAMLQGGAGPAAVQRLIQVAHVDYNPVNQVFTDWDVRAGDLKDRLRPYLEAKPVQVPTGNAVIPDAKKRRPLLDSLKAITDTRPNLSAPDVPTLAPLVSGHVQGKQGLSTGEQARLTTAVLSALSGASFTMTKADGSAFESLLTRAATTSQAKGAPNVIAVGQLPGPLQGPTTLIAGLVRSRNQALVATGLRLPRFPLVTGLANRASVDMDSIRSTHTNSSGWLPAAAPVLPMAFAPLENAVLAAVPAALQAQLNAGADLTPAESVALEAALLAALGAVPSNRERMALHWGAYAMTDAGQLYPYVEFAGPSTEVSRFVYDYANGAFYLSVHYRWHRGYNPFFRVTGLLEW